MASGKNIAGRSANPVFARKCNSLRTVDREAVISISLRVSKVEIGPYFFVLPFIRLYGRVISSLR